MKIVHAIWGLTTGGAEIMLIDIINVQIKSENVALIVVNDLVNESLLRRIDKRCRVKFLHRKVGSKSLIPWIKMNIFLMRYQADIIHFHLEGMRKMVIYPAPKVFTIHNMHTSGKEYSRYNALYAISDAVRERTKKQGFDSITVLNGICSEEILIKQNCDRKPQKIIRLISVGRLYIPHKGQDVLIKSLSILKNRDISNFHLDLIGEGESRMAIELMIKELKLTEYVTLLGQKDRAYIYSHLRDYDMFILPSKSEGFGLAIVEAMCAKVPVLTSNLPGPMEVIGNGALGMCFKSEDFVDLADKIRLFIEKGYSKETIETAFCLAMKNYNIATTANKYISSYKDIISSRCKHR